MPWQLKSYHDEEGKTHWVGTAAQRETITCHQVGDEFKDWLTGWVWGVEHAAGPWVQLRRELPECRKIDPDDYTL